MVPTTLYWHPPLPTTPTFPLATPTTHLGMPTLYAAISRKGQYKIVPVLVGALTEEREAAYGQLFSKYLAQPENLFVVSSDFCHWGEVEGGWLRWVGGWVGVTHGRLLAAKRV